MRGEYGAAIACCDRALALRRTGVKPESRALAEARAGFIHRKGGNEGAATKVKKKADPTSRFPFNKAAKNGGEEVEMSGDESMSVKPSRRSGWVPRAQTRPADFPKAKFSYQQTVEQEGGR
ncbi:MAG: hypothetical protein H7A54_04430 [Akkermansiaceae bacterium]|nr:hypothetical protein [Akkermansiaceae bacterium]